MNLFLSSLVRNNFCCCPCIFPPSLTLSLYIQKYAILHLQTLIYFQYFYIHILYLAKGYQKQFIPYNICTCIVHLQRSVYCSFAIHMYGTSSIVSLTFDLQKKKLLNKNNSITTKLNKTHELKNNTATYPQTQSGRQLENMKQNQIQKMKKIKKK